MPTVRRSASWVSIIPALTRGETGLLEMLDYKREDAPTPAELRRIVDPLVERIVLDPDSRTLHQ
jgi:hypothetical protein